MQKKAIVFAVDDSPYQLHLLSIALNSVRCFQPEKYDIFILTNTELPHFDIWEGVTVLNISKEIKEYGLDNTNSWWLGKPTPAMMLSRILIPVLDNLLLYDKVLYLDTDTEVQDKRFFSIFEADDLHELILVNERINQKLLKARMQPLLNLDEIFPEVYTRCKYYKSSLESYSYGNSGVIVFNMFNFRNQKDIKNRIRVIRDALVRTRPICPDQDIINVMFFNYYVQNTIFNLYKDAPCYLRHNITPKRYSMFFYPNQEHRSKKLLTEISKRVYVRDDTYKDGTLNSTNIDLYKVSLTKLPEVTYEKFEKFLSIKKNYNTFEKVISVFDLLDIYRFINKVIRIQKGSVLYSTNSDLVNYINSHKDTDSVCLYIDSSLIIKGCFIPSKYVYVFYGLLKHIFGSLERDHDIKKLQELLINNKIPCSIEVVDEDSPKSKDVNLISTDISESRSPVVDNEDTVNDTSSSISIEDINNNTVECNPEESPPATAICFATDGATKDNERIL